MSRRRRKISVSPQGGLNSDINITPMVDVVLVLLIIFMVVTPLLEKDIEVKVPDSEKVEEPLDVPQDQLVVSLSASGEFKINLDVMPDQATYIARLSRMLAARNKGDRFVFFTADGMAQYPKFVTLIDGARQAGGEPAIAIDKIDDAPAP